jgi:hypothetical protein
MLQKPERIHKRNAKVITTDVFNPIPSRKSFEKQIPISNRTYYREQLEKKSKKTQPTRIKTFNSMKIENPYNSIIDIIHTEPSPNED